MSNTKRAVTGDVVRYVGGPCFDITEGKLYHIYDAGMTGSGYGASFYDDKGNKRCFWLTDKYEIIGNAEDLRSFLATIQPSLKDVHGQDVLVGDYVAYAFAGHMHKHLAVFEVQQINGPAALCRSVIDSAVTTLGVFEERALKLKDYNK